MKRITVITIIGLLLSASLVGQLSSSSFSDVCVPSGTHMSLFGEHSFMNNSHSVWRTDRSDVLGSYVAFGPGSSWSGAGDSSYVDGSVRSFLDGYFVYPTGDQNVYKPIALGQSQDATTSYRHLRPIDHNSKKTEIEPIKTAGYWSLSSSAIGHITLPYDMRSELGSSYQKEELSILGYNGTQWVPIPSAVDPVSIDLAQSGYQLSIMGSTDQEGTITTTEEIDYSLYHYLTVGLRSKQNTNTQTLTVFPNPVSQNGIVIIRYKHMLGSAGRLSVVDQDERIVYTRKLHRKEGSIRLHLNGLRPGSYWIKLTGANNVSTLSQLVVVAK